MKGVALLAGAAIVALAAILLPSPVGAGMRPVAVQGSSMVPALRPGDLVIVAPQESYLPGQVVAYRSPELGNAVLVHRVAGYEGERLVLKGDANPFTDSYRPSQEEVLGAVVATAPGLGRPALALMEPQWAGAVAGGAAAAMVALGGRRRRLLLPPVLLFYGLAAGVLLLGTGAAGLLAAGLLPPTQVVRTPIAYSHEGEWSYEAPSLLPVYQGGAVARTGEPLFLRLVRPVTFTFHYRPPPAVREARGSISLYATIGDYSPSGWRRTIPLAGPVPMQGDETAITAVLDLGEAARAWHELAQATGLTAQAARLEVVAQVHLEGALEGAPLADDVPFRLPFRMDALQAALEPPPDGRMEALLSPTVEKTLIAPLEQPRQVGMGGIRVPLGKAQRISLYLLWAGGAILALTAAVALLALRTPAGLAALMGAPVVRAAGTTYRPEGQGVAVEVTGVADLVRAARAASAPVVAHPDGALSVAAGGAVYLWRPAGGSRRAPAAAPEKGGRAP